jgi:hypothetical protein
MEKQQSIIVSGPQASGKTLHAEEIKKHFGLDTVVEMDNLDLSSAKLAESGVLYLTNIEPHALVNVNKIKVPVLTIAQAKAKAGIVDEVVVAVDPAAPGADETVETELNPESDEVQ